MWCRRYRIFCFAHSVYVRCIQTIGLLCLMSADFNWLWFASTKHRIFGSIVAESEWLGNNFFEYLQCFLGLFWAALTLKRSWASILEFQNFCVYFAGWNVFSRVISSCSDSEKLMNFVLQYMNDLCIFCSLKLLGVHFVFIPFSLSAACF